MLSNRNVRRGVVALVLISTLVTGLLPAFGQSGRESQTSQPPKRRTLKRDTNPPGAVSASAPAATTGSKVEIEDLGQPPISASSDKQANYKIRPGDELTITVWGQELLSKAYIVGPDGQFSMPLAGVIDAKALTRDQLSERISHRLESIYQQPLVSIVVSKYSPRHAFVLGEVGTPGEVEFVEDMTFLRALSKAGGVRRDTRDSHADEFQPPERAYLVRSEENKIITIDLEDVLFRGNLAGDVPVENNDLIYIPTGKREQVFVLGHVNRPGVVPLRRKDATVLAAVTEAGGFKDGAAKADVKLIRRTGPDDKSPKIYDVDVRHVEKTGDLSVNLDLQDQDVIFVPQTGLSKFTVFLQNGYLGLLGLAISLTRRY